MLVLHFCLLTRLLEGLSVFVHTRCSRVKVVVGCYPTGDVNDDHVVHIHHEVSERQTLRTRELKILDHRPRLLPGEDSDRRHIAAAERARKIVLDKGNVAHAADVGALRIGSNTTLLGALHADALASTRLKHSISRHLHANLTFVKHDVVINYLHRLKYITQVHKAQLFLVKILKASTYDVEALDDR